MITVYLEFIASFYTESSFHICQIMLSLQSLLCTKLLILCDFLCVIFQETSSQANLTCKSNLLKVFFHFHWFCWKWAMMVGEFLELARANIAIQSCLNYTELFCRWKNRCLIDCASQHYERLYIQYIMRIFLGDLVDSENYYHESQIQLICWYLWVGLTCI